MKLKLSILLVLLIFGFSTVNVEASKVYTIDDDPSSASYFVEHVIGFSSGQFLNFNGTIKLSNDEKKVELVDVVIDTQSLSTHDEVREAGLKGSDFLNVEHFPEITIKSKKITKDKIFADVTILGITKKVEFVYFDYGVMPMKGKPYAMVGMQGKVDRRDFGMDYNVKSEKSDQEMLGTEFEITLHLDAALEK